MAFKTMYICSNCGSGNVYKDALARWDLKSQTWLIHILSDTVICQGCDDNEAQLESFELQMSDVE
jgi:hypothetical protein